MSRIFDQSSSRSLEFQSANEILGLLRSRKIGAVELLNLHVARIKKYNPSLNAVVALDVETALNAARQADNQKSDLRMLHGLPMTVKDGYEAVGMPTTCGFPFLADYRPQQDADAVTHLKAAGAIVFGKTNLPSGAFDWQSYNPVYGMTTNPWDSARSPGGSSGGAAAAIAAGFTPLELGSDMGGSIRCPAAFCGVYGHKPSYGIVPMRGHIPPLPGTDMRLEMVVGGPLARSAADLELALDVLVAPSKHDGAAWRVRLPEPRHQRLQDFRVALWADNSGYAVDERCLEAMHAYAEDLRRLGVTVDVTARPDIDLHASYEAYLMTLLPLLAGGLAPDVRQQFLDTAEAMGSGNLDYMARAGRAFALKRYESYAVTEQRERLYHAWRGFFDRYDLLICPVMQTVAYQHDLRGDETGNPIHVGAARDMIVNCRSYQYLDRLQWPSLATVANLPATAVPTGRFIDGVPMGVQVIGPYLEDRTPLRFAQLVERALGGYQVPPAYSVPIDPN